MTGDQRYSQDTYSRDGYSPDRALDRFRLDDRVVLVTGASSGLGRRFARVAAGAGATVVAAARRADRLAELVDQLDSAHAITVDLAAPGGPEQCVAEAIERAGRVDVLINNAGISTVASALEFSTDEFRHEIEIDLVAPFALAREVAAAAISAERSANIINIGSVLGAVGGGKLRVPGYAAAKGGLHNLTRELAAQWSRKGIRVNAIAPGWFESEMTDAMFGNDSAEAYMRAGAPMGRPGIDGELDGAMLFLASDASSFVTGHILHVDGGWVAI